MFKKLLFVLLIVLLTLSLPAMAEEEVILGRLTKLGVDEDTLNEAISDVFFSLVPFSRYQFFDTLNSMVLALNSKAIAGFQVDEFTAKYLMSRNENFVEFKTTAAPPYLLDYSMLLREENAELRDSISAVIEDMRADGTLDALKQQYIDNVIAGTEPDAIPVEKFEGAETIKVALTGDRPPMDYFSAAGEPIGFNTALLSEVGKRLGKNVEFVIPAHARFRFLPVQVILFSGQKRGTLTTGMALIRKTSRKTLSLRNLILPGLLLTSY